MIFDVTAITPHQGLIIRDPSQAGLILAGYEPTGHGRCDP
jgi:hypothetical protein